MTSRRTPKTATLTDLLREALGNVDSIRAVAREAGIHHASLLRFYRGERTLKLDNAEKLMSYFGLEVRQKEVD